MDDHLFVYYSPAESNAHEEALFWSNEDGWTVLPGATWFTQEEVRTFNAPLDSVVLHKDAAIACVSRVRINAIMKELGF